MITKNVIVNWNYRCIIGEYKKKGTIPYQNPPILAFYFSYEEILKNR